MASTQPHSLAKKENCGHSRERREERKKENQIMSIPYDPDIIFLIPQILSPSTGGYLTAPLYTQL